MKFSAARAKLPSLKNSLLAVLSAILLILSFPDFEFWFLAYVGLVPLLYAIEKERESVVKSFVLGWIFGVCFFFGTCWWLTYAPINYGGVPPVIAYLLLFGATLIVGLFPALFAGLFSLVLKRFGSWGIFSAPFLWTAIEFLRFWVTGNNWNAIGYSQAFNSNINQLASFGGIYLVGFLTVFANVWLSIIFYSYYFWWGSFLKQFWRNVAGLKKYESPDLIEIDKPSDFKRQKEVFVFIVIALLAFQIIFSFLPSTNKSSKSNDSFSTQVIAIQPNVPMSGLKSEDRLRLRERHVQLSESVLQMVKEQSANNRGQTVIIFPESPMNFEYAGDAEFQGFLRRFTTKNNVSVLFNAAEPTVDNKGLYNSAVLVNERGTKIAQYDKIHLVPFGEYVPLSQTLASVIPTMVGSFEFGKSYDLIPFGDAQAGIMICFESHFPTLSREFARQGADVLVELTNDGYLGNTPVLRQHLANAVFRAVETNRPVLRVTNVGITAYIDENGKIYDETKPYTEDARVWTVKKSDAPQTFYVKYGDWFAWVCSVVSLILLILSLRKKKGISAVG